MSAPTALVEPPSPAETAEVVRPLPGPSGHLAVTPTAVGSDVLCHRLAVTTALVSLLPITLGVLTTTYDAGMAFPDWPTSAGENMFLYDVIADVFAGARDKVLEHGHRLAGALIGLTTLITAGVFTYRRGRRAETYVVWAAVAAVIVQGLLGGFRVRLDERAVAMAHGLGGAFVFTALISLAAITSRAWVRVADAGSGRLSKSAVVWGYVLVAAVVAQYTLGGFVRHLGWGLWTHMGSASAVFVAAIVVGVIAMRTRVPTLRRVGWMLHAVVTVQIALGFAAWWTKYAPAEGAVVDLTAPATVWSRSLHAVTGMALLATSVAYVLFVTRLKSSSGRPVGAVAGSSS